MLTRDLLDDPKLILSESETVENVAGWDSVAHVQIMLAIEDAFEVRFMVEELTEFQNLGELVSRIRALHEAASSSGSTEQSDRGGKPI
jgi:acyl carrier protein